VLDPDKTNEVSPEDTKTRLAKAGDGLRFVDCREMDEFEYCRIEGAELIPLSRFAELAPGLLGDDFEQEIIVYCHHGVRSLQATYFLRQRGYKNTFSMAGGIDVWSAQIDQSVPRY